MLQGHFGDADFTPKGAKSFPQVSGPAAPDELRLKIFSVVLGAGERLFGETSDKKPMRLVDTQTLGDGIAFLTYEPIRNA